jgi:hypothetical protein
VSRPPEHEQWASWGPGEGKDIKRLGINFGAPGDRMSPQGTLWLDVPGQGGPSPEVKVAIEPETAQTYYRHSLFMEGGKGWPWVTASGIEGARTIRIQGLKPQSATVRLYFSEPDHHTPQERVFDVALNGKTVANDLDLVKLAGGPMRGWVQTSPNIELGEELTIDLLPQKGETILSGVEIVPTGEALDQFTEK